MNQYYLGVMSGTSLDAIDIVLTQVSSLLFEGLYSYPIPENIRNLTSRCVNDLNVDFLTVRSLESSWNQLYSDAICDAVYQSKKKIRAVGLHGQTIYHDPNTLGSIQLGSIAAISALTGLRVIGDFRSKDIALGGQGAPLAPLFHQAFFSKFGRKIAVVNLGGIANISIIDHQKVYGYDLGPGNAILDDLVRKYYDLPYDDRGKLAQSGQVNVLLLNKLLSDDYFSRQRPKSTGRDYFNLGWLESKLTETMHTKDLLATMVELIACVISQALPNEVDEVLVCGGGSNNQYLMNRIRSLSEVDVLETSERGVPSQAVEAMGFAWLAHQHIEGIKMDLSQTTGSSKSYVLGVSS